MTVPSGQPSWTRSATALTYGGHPDKRDYQAQGVVNPRTDISAAEFLRLAADVAALARVAPYCLLVARCNDSGTPAAPTVERVQQMGVVAISGYPGGSPPDPALPSLARVGDGEFTVSWPVLAEDDFGVEGSVNLAHVQVTVLDETGATGVEVSWASATVLELKVVDGSGTAIPDARVSIEVA